MKILFLDIDGVLNSEQSARFFARERRKAQAGDTRFTESLGRAPLREDEFCPIASNNLLCLLEEIPDLQIVVSSTWRLNRTTEQLRDILAKAGVPRDRVYGRTDAMYDENDHAVQRGVEIRAWLDAHALTLKDPVDNFVVLDDDSDMDAVRDNFFKTEWKVGLTIIDVFKVVDFLNPKNDMNKDTKAMGED